ncbi:bifunctional nicotinamidase/pyrazinamidase [Salinarimonas rosea]|uniref:bifunctional nicotinamidase/pyrazinamidase n=1 Tax=Salinarimonas rosea TaxID=552063 RepID=UPI00041CF490|nr:bifunctional nicotinamidase/pyrazinamidase [Salinarimonas rosea]
MDPTLGEEDVLLAIDVQYDFLPGGALAVADGDGVIAPIDALARRFASHRGHLVLTQDWHPPHHASFASSHPGKAAFETIQMPYGPQVLWPDHCVQGSRGAEISRGLDCASAAELVIRKGFHKDVDSYSAFREADRHTHTGLAGYLRERGLKRVFCAGLATDFCVAWTALDARAEGFETVVVIDACRAIDQDGSLAKALADLERAGVVICETGDLLA